MEQRLKSLHGQRNETLASIQQELCRLADLSQIVVSTEQMRKKHRFFSAAFVTQKRHLAFPASRSAQDLYLPVFQLAHAGKPPVKWRKTKAPRLK